MPGEGVLRASAMRVIGQDGFDHVNNLGNRILSEGIAPQNDNEGQNGGGTVNVWVVSPDQQPSTGPNDIVVAIADNIQRRGTIKQLIQQVQLGTI